jgi:hypothetical protein
MSSNKLGKISRAESAVESLYAPSGREQNWEFNQTFHFPRYFLSAASRHRKTFKTAS